MLLQELRVSLQFEDFHTDAHRCSQAGGKQKTGGFSVIENTGELVIMMVTSLVH